MSESVDRRRIAVIDGDSRHDLVLPLHATIADALDAVGLDLASGTGAVVDASGRRVIASSEAANIDDGAVLAFVDTDAARRRSPGRHGESIDRLGREAAPWLLAAVSAIVSIFAVLLPDAVPTPLRVTLVLALALAALLGGAPLRREAAGHPRFASIASRVFAAFAAGAILVPPLPSSGVVVTVLAGLLAAAIAAGALALIAPAEGPQSALATASILLLVYAAFWALALLLSLPPAAPAAVSLGAAPVALRVLLAGVVEVPPGLFIDYARYQSTRWSVRQRLPEEIHSVAATDARAIVARSAARLRAGTVVICVSAALAAPLTLTTFTLDDPVVGWGRIALTVCVVLALLLAARRASTVVLRWVPRGAALLIAAVSIWIALPMFDDAVLAIGALACLVIGVFAALATFPASRGRMSLFWSRFGDVVEWLATVLALPAALLAAGAIETIRGMMAA